MSTLSRTTTGWMPTALDITRGWMRFMVTNQPAPMTSEMGMSASGWVSTAAGFLVLIALLGPVFTSALTGVMRELRRPAPMQPLGNKPSVANLSGRPRGAPVARSKQGTPLHGAVAANSRGQVRQLLESAGAAEIRIYDQPTPDGWLAEFLLQALPFIS